MAEGTEPEVTPPAAPSGSALGDADPEELARAAQELRRRTMSLEQLGHLPELRWAFVLIAATLVVAGLTFHYRHAIRVWLGLG